MTIETYCKEICKSQFDDVEKLVEALDEHEKKIRADERERIINELEKAKKSLVGRYDKSTPMMEMPSYKVAFNQGIEKAIEIFRGDANENEI